MKKNSIVRVSAMEIIDSRGNPTVESTVTLEDGSGKPRQVVSGIHAWYEPADLVGKTVAVVANLKPAKLRGVMSEGMILAADIGDSAKVIFLDESVPAGARIR